MFIFVLFTNAMTNISQFEYVTINDKSLDGVLGNRTRGRRMEGAPLAAPLFRMLDVSSFVKLSL